MLHKAWPPELNNENQLDEEKQDEILLNHLLTWQAWPGFLKIFGKKFLDHHTIDSTLTYFTRNAVNSASIVLSNFFTHTGGSKRCTIRAWQ